ncbi:ABC transporter permease [Telmatospirillum sp.]|uniref:ABC transporter permease n=1 Tax=Telmatospirillum sp. TaxID=2079197 RepID=UPI0028469D44|nr:ABC transporter permease [Telmatospirillum sp.]MDR3436003.1 ABC transporter permease [Telmatospirillum sp.]
MGFYVLRRVIYALPIALSVTVVCFLLVHIAPGDPLNAVAPADAPVEVINALKVAYGFDQPLPVQYFRWLGRALAGDLGTSVATGRPVLAEVMTAVVNTILLAVFAAVLGFSLGAVLGGMAGYRHKGIVDRIATALSVIGVSVPHYWLGMVLTIIFSSKLNWLPAMGAGPGGSKEWLWDAEHLRYLVLPVTTLAVIPLGIVTRTIRALVADILSKDFVQALRAKGMSDRAVFLHVVKNVAPTALAVMGLQLGYLLGGSILVETVFAWPGSGFLLNTAIFQRDLPLLQGTILILCMIFVLLNLLVDIIQPAIDPRMRRS